jgi:hypothetical protein
LILLEWLKNMLSSLFAPCLIAAGAVALFMVAYLSHCMLGDNNVIEETAEELLKREYKIDVEFSEVKEK